VENRVENPSRKKEKGEREQGINQNKRGARPEWHL